MYETETRIMTRIMPMGSVVYGRDEGCQRKFKVVAVIEGSIRKGRLPFLR